MQHISPAEFPPHAKSLGARFLGYVLNMEEQEIEVLFKAGGELKKHQYQTLLQVEQLVHEVKIGRLRESTLSYSEVSDLSHYVDAQGAVAFNALRLQSGGDCLPLESDDPVKRVLSEMCVAYFPIILLPISSAQVQSGRLIKTAQHAGGQFFQKFCKAATDDAILGKLYEGDDDGPDAKKKFYFTHIGGSRANLRRLSDSLLKSGAAVMQARGQKTSEDFQRAVWQMVDVLRSAIEGQPTKAPVFTIYDTVEFLENAEISFEFGQIRPIPLDFIRHFQNRGELFVDDPESIHGCILETEYDYDVQIGPAVDQPEPPKEVAETNLQKLNLQAFPLATSFVVASEKRCAARFRAQMTICPLDGPNQSWRPATSISRKKHTTSLEEASQIAEKLNSLLKVDYSNIEFSIERFLGAVNDKSLVNGLIDTAIAFENLTADRTQITFSIAVATANFLFETLAEREKCFEDIKYAYSVRSDFVHGNRAKQLKADIEKANFRLIDYLNALLEKICTEQPWLIDLRNSERSKKMAMWDHKLTKHSDNI